MKQYRTVNNLMGWLHIHHCGNGLLPDNRTDCKFLGLPRVYNYRLQTGSRSPAHAPFFMLMANLFTQFASDVTTVAKW